MITVLPHYVIHHNRFISIAICTKSCCNVKSLLQPIIQAHNRNILNCFILIPGHLHAHSPEQGGDDQSLRPPSLAPSPYSSPLLTPRLGHTNSNEGSEGDRSSLATLQALGSTETLKKGGGDEPLLSSCESAKTICGSKDTGEEGALRTPSISVEEERDEAAEVDSLAEGSVGVAESEDRFDWASDEAPRRPDSLKGIQSFQRSHSNLASLGLAFPAQNGSLAIGRWPSTADRGSMPEDWESYTYSPGYERTHSKTESNDRYAALAANPRLISHY